ncbi:c-type cytochrome [Ravibacter arvi]|uniref:c-type cytochrome n=1 Tax=Ravibacter arvi TaxID=2051041 RepID=UPI0031EB3D5E
MNSICRNFYSLRKRPYPTSFLPKCTSVLLVLVFLVFANTPILRAQDAEAPAAAAAGGLEGDVAVGEALFKSNCSSCHETGTTKSVGPGLKDVHKKHDFQWLVKWIHNSQSMVAAGDPAALKIYNEFNKIPMTSFPTLSEDEIKGILAYIESANNQPAAAAATGAVAAGAAQSEGPSTLFVVLLVVLVVVVVLLSIVLLVVLNLLSRSVDGGREVKKSGESFGSLLGRAARHPAILSATAWVFVLLVVKVTLDGAFNVGVQQGYAPKQPIAFSHKLHAGEYEIDCNYCHTGVNKSRAATIPAANICMNCHGVIKRESPEIQKIYASIQNNQPIEWVRVHNLPDLAYFNHSQHVNVGGVECETCHGDIKKMEVVEQRSSLTMGWCIDCHRTTDVNAKGNAYYDKLVQVHGEEGKGTLKVADIGGLECSKCHY